MNKQDALAKLSALEAETRALRAIIEAPEVPAVPVRWRPEGDDSFLAVSAIGEVQRYCNSPDRVKFGNCFQTVDHATIAAKAVSVTLKVCAAAFAVDPDAGEYKKCHREIAVHKVHGQWRAQTFVNDVGAQIYVHSVEKGELMAAMLNAEGV